MKHGLASEIEGDGSTAALCQWIHTLRPSDIPLEVQERAKHLILDGLGCALVGAHVPWSEQLAESTSIYEPPGTCSVIGYQEVSNSTSPSIPHLPRTKCT